MCVVRQFGVAFLVFSAPFAVLTAAPSESFAEENNDTAPWSLPAALRQMTDWGGARTRLEQAGVKFTFNYYGDAFNNPTGGIQQGPGYDGRFAGIVDADLEKLIGWNGADFHASLHQIHGTQFSVTNPDNLMTVSGSEAPQSTRLFNLWVAQDIGNDANIRIGQFTAAQEFQISDNANLFVNSTFGWPLLSGDDLPSGGPNFPEATPGVRFRYNPNASFTFQAAVFNGDPAGPGVGNPVERDPHGLAFRVNDPPLFIAEFAYAYDHARPEPVPQNPKEESGARRQAQTPATTDLPNTIKVGAWLNTGLFNDQRYNTAGGLLAASGSPLQHHGDYALYGIVDHELWTDPGMPDRSLNVFLRGTAAPGDRNLIDLYVDCGITLEASFSSRPHDTVGIAAAYGHISPRASAFDRDAIAVTGTPMPVRDFEATIELTYQWVVAKNWYFQPNLQYVVHPGGNIANPNAGPGIVSSIPNALVFGLRSFVQF
ncbi:MAG TPA: carbohydrate porin [Xanthobacteraceae bacterium]|jgi:porin|nr:carbohydrate porin [Xanthobacteraceae bacterium]